MEAAIQALSETLTGFLGVDATGAIDGDGDDEPALVTRLNEVAGAAAEAFAASTAAPPVLRSPTALGMWEFGNAAAQCRAADAALTEALIAGLSKSEKGARPKRRRTGLIHVWPRQLESLLVGPYFGFAVARHDAVTCARNGALPGRVTAA